MTARKTKLSTISAEELKKLPYITELPSDGRLVMIHAFWDDQKDDWIFFVQVRASELGRLAGGEPIVAPYLSHRPENPERDLELKLATFLFQHLSFPSVVPHIAPITDDVAQFAVILQNFELIEQHARDSKGMASLLAASTLEHLIIVIRATFDLLQKLIKGAASIVHRTDARSRKLIQQLPDSFTQVVLHGETPRSTGEIAQKFTLPAPLADFYAKEADFFRILRNLRVGIEHYGDGLPTIFPDKDRFLVRTTDFPWTELGVWKESELIENRLGPLCNVYNNLIRHTIETLSSSNLYLSISRSVALFVFGIRIGTSLKAERQYQLSLIQFGK
jgi:hypothetical protein